MINRNKKYLSINKNIFRTFDSLNSNYEVSSYIISSNLNFTNYNFSEINKTIQINVNDTQFNFIENVQENNQKFNMKILKSYDKDTEKDYKRIKIIKNFSDTNIFYSSNDKVFNLNEEHYSNFNFKIKLYEDINEVKCEINYPGLLYKEKNNSFLKLNDSNYTNIIYKKILIFEDMNIVLPENMKGIFIEKYSNGYLSNRTSLGDLINDEEKDLNIDNYFFSDFFLSENVSIDKNYLILKEINSTNIYLIQIINKRNNNKLNEKSQLSIINFDFRLLNIFDKSQFYTINLDKILSFNVLPSNYFLLSVNEENDKSLNKISYSNKIENIIKIRSFKYLNQISLIDYDEKEINLDIINLKIRNDLCYMSISNFGLITYNIQQESFNIIFRHEKITTFILSQNNYNYIGIFLNNNYIENNYINNRDSREFYVEIRKNENKENYYEINKIFYSDKSSKNEFFNNYVHDSISDYLFFISNENNIIYYIKINLPYLYDNFDGKFSIQNKVNNKIFKGFNFINYDYYNFKEDNKINHSNLLVLQSEMNKENLFFYDFYLNKDANYKCSMKNSANFTIINSYMIYDKKENCFKSINQIKKVNILLNEPEMNLSKIWLILLIIFSIGFIIGTIYYFCNKKKKIDDSNLIYNFAKFHEF